MYPSFAWAIHPAAWCTFKPSSPTDFFVTTWTCTSMSAAACCEPAAPQFKLESATTSSLVASSLESLLWLCLLVDPLTAALLRTL